MESIQDSGQGQGLGSEETVVMVVVRGHRGEGKAGSVVRVREDSRE